MSDSNRVYAGILFFLGSAQFLTILMIGEAMALAYSVYGNAISDLGVIGETRALFNTSLFLTGLFIALGGYLFHRTHGKLWITILFILAGIGAMGAGVFNLEFGIHGIFALIAFLFVNFQAIASATLIRGPLKTLSVILGIIGLIALGLHFAGDIGGITAAFGPIGHGGSERMIVYPGLLWLMAFGGYLMAPRALATKE
jgi:hypothetical membrane protein